VTSGTEETEREGMKGEGKERRRKRRREGQLKPHLQSPAFSTD